MTTPEMQSMTDYDRDWWTHAAMQKFGGSFVQLLGQAARVADATNHEKIKTTWPEYWAKYSAMGVELWKKEKGQP